MRVTGIAYYTSAVLLALAGMLSLITVMPEREGAHGWTMTGVVVAAFACLVLAIGLRRLPAEHWAHRSRPLRLGLAALAGLLTVVAVLIL